MNFATAEVTMLGKTHPMITTELTGSSDVFDKILKAYGDEPYRKHERARGCFFHALALRNLGDVAKAEERMVEAAQLFNEISPNDIRTSQTLSAEDVDRLNFHDML